MISVTEPFLNLKINTHCLCTNYTLSQYFVITIMAYMVLGDPLTNSKAARQLRCGVQLVVRGSKRLWTPLVVQHVNNNAHRKRSCLMVFALKSSQYQFGTQLGMCFVAFIK